MPGPACNNILTTKNYPKEWKNAIIIPIFKQGKKENIPGNYRPITLVNCMSKIFEKILSNRLQFYLEKNKLYPSSFFAFRKGLGARDCLLKIYDFIQLSFSKKQHVDCINLDIEKAFNQSSKFLIIQNLLELGVKGNILNIIDSFLSDRKFKVKVNEIFSKEQKIKNLLPQGSPLSPILFQIAIFNIIKDLMIDENIKIFVYADDITVIGSSLKSNENTKISKNIKTLYDWADSNGFFF